MRTQSRTRFSFKTQYELASIVEVRFLGGGEGAGQHVDSKTNPHFRQDCPRFHFDHGLLFQTGNGKTSAELAVRAALDDTLQPHSSQK